MSGRSEEVLTNLLSMLKEAKNTDKTIGIIVDSGIFYLEGETEIFEVIDEEGSIRIEGRQISFTIDTENFISVEHDDIDDDYTITYSDKTIYIV